MTVKELKKELEQYPDHMDVFLGDRKTEFRYGLLNGVYTKKIDFMEEPDGEVLSSEIAVILDEE